MEQNLVIGIDVGGQTTKCGVVDARGTVLAQTVIRSDSYTTVEPYIEELAAALKKIITDAGAEGQIRGIGVGAPNANYYTGEVENAVGVLRQRPQIARTPLTFLGEELVRFLSPRCLPKRWAASL